LLDKETQTSQQQKKSQSKNASPKITTGDIVLKKCPRNDSKTLKRSNIVQPVLPAPPTCPSCRPQFAPHALPYGVESRASTLGVVQGGVVQKSEPARLARDADAVETLARCYQG